MELPIEEPSDRIMRLMQKSSEEAFNAHLQCLQKAVSKGLAWYADIVDSSFLQRLDTQHAHFLRYVLYSSCFNYSTCNDSNFYHNFYYVNQNNSK